MLKGTVEDLLANRLDVDMKLTSTSGSISIEIITKEGYPTSYSYQITGPEEYKKEANNLKENTYTFEELKIDTEYSIKVTVKNKAGLIKEITKAIKTLAPAEPVLGNLKPVVYKNNNWVVADTSKEWYNYSNQEWANAVLLRTGISKTVGQIVTVTGSNPEAIAMFVWIPRYEYKITSQYNIDVNFISEDVVYDGANSDGYRVHPAFKFGTEELPGIWVGKFETSAEKTSECYLTVNETNCNNENQEPYILPNVSSLRYQNISNEFKTAQKLNNLLSNDIDSHMMKNSEWGAVAYLTQSKYGINKEIAVNDNDGFLTGGGNYIINVAQSTTGNITGIYDMSGGAWEYVMGVLNGATSLTEFKNLPDTRYYDNYTSETLEEACDGKECYGHALSETVGWYSDFMNFVSSTGPWGVRSGGPNNGNVAGVYAQSADNGRPIYYISFRIVISPTT